MLLDTYRSSLNSSSWVLASSNTYYNSTNASTGAVAGLLESTTSYNYEYQGGTLTPLSQTSYDVYDAQGNVLLSYTPKNIGTSSSPDWVFSASFTTYNMNGQQLNTSSATYTDPATVGSSTDQMSITVTWNTDPSSTTTGGVTTTDIPTTSLAPLPSSQTTYTPDGQTQTTTDQYGGVTTNIYDSAGNLVQTLYPDGTEVRSVFNALGQVVWQTDRYATTTLATGVDDNTDTANATETIYNSLGQVVETERYSNVLITINNDQNAPTGSPLRESALNDPTDPGQWLSTATSVYNGAGQEVETDSPTGLRTGTIYYPDGSVEYTGPLNPAASATWYLSANPLNSFQVNAGTGRGEYTTYLFNQTAPISSYPWSGMVYNETIDANGNATETFADSSGRTIFTVYPDSSFTESVYSTGDQAITLLPSSLVGNYSLPSINIPQGGSETISIAQRKNILSDTIDLTVDVYDLAGNLVDVYEPPVMDADPSSPTYGIMISPHWHYDYDASGDEINQVDPRGEETKWTYDANGNELTHTLPDMNSEIFTYNMYGQQATHTDFDGNIESDTYYSNYSSGAYAGLLQDADYYSPGATIGVSTPAETVAYTYTTQGQESQIVDSADGTTTYGYNSSNGDLVSVASPQGTIHYVYDPTTNLLIETWTGTGSSDTTSMTDTLYGYTNQGQLESVTVARQDDAAPSQSFSGNKYSAAGVAIATNLLEPGIESGARAGGESGATWFLKIAPGGAASNNF